MHRDSPGPAARIIVITCENQSCKCSLRILTSSRQHKSFTQSFIAHASPASSPFLPMPSIAPPSTPIRETSLRLADAQFRPHSFPPQPRMQSLLPAPTAHLPLHPRPPLSKTHPSSYRFRIILLLNCRINHPRHAHPRQTLSLHLDSSSCEYTPDRTLQPIQIDLMSICNRRQSFFHLIHPLTHLTISRIPHEEPVL